MLKRAPNSSNAAELTVSLGAADGKPPRQNPALLLSLPLIPVVGGFIQVETMLVGSLGECLQLLLPNLGQLQPPQDSPPPDGQQWALPRYLQERGDANSTARQDAQTSSVAPPPDPLIDSRSRHT